eukprot:CAMPEP_0119349704 /NCGR_PEP_ID=MMETSP1333-20130426/109687_1 /TAXON_ID=418940 /ORGANISM="Scyphosphaera apsteinii, Strain RCC1455" /LENGTH=68 /DNA_ID=CAMNT_0007362307 /DNA_START=749 /DNA_END=955 /DNA_ORIENTATION=+
MTLVVAPWHELGGGGGLGGCGGSGCLGGGGGEGKGGGGCCLAMQKMRGVMPAGPRSLRPTSDRTEPFR